MCVKLSTSILRRDGRMFLSLSLPILCRMCYVMMLQRRTWRSTDLPSNNGSPSHISPSLMITLVSFHMMSEILLTTCSWGSKKFKWRQQKMILKRNLITGEAFSQQSRRSVPKNHQQSPRSNKMASRPQSWKGRMHSSSQFLSLRRDQLHIKGRDQ